MTVAVVSRFQNFVGAGLTGPYTFNFPILISNSNTPYITVTQISAAGVPTVLAYPADYSFTAVQLGLGGGIVTTAVAVPGDGSRLFIEATTPLDQGVGYSNQGDFFPETHEKSYDKLHYIVQEASRNNNTAIRIPTTDVVGTSTTLPTATARANKVMAFDSDGDVTVSSQNLSDIEAGSTAAAASAASAAASASAASSSASSASTSATNAANTVASMNYRYCDTAGGTANALTLAPATALASYAGALIDFFIATANTSETVTVNVSTLGAKNIKVNTGGTKKNPAIGMFQAGMNLICQYDGTDFVVLNAPWDNQASDIASATTVALASVTGNFANITGTTTITGFSGLTKGRRILIRHTGVHQLTHSSTFFLLNNAGNMTTAAGDFSEWVSDGTNVYMTRYHKANGQPITAALAVSGGTVDNSVVGGTTAAAGTFTTLAATSLLNLSGASAGQIQFPATQNASANANTLDDYEEGTWTPGVSFGGGTTGITYTTQVGRYTKIGNVVIMEYRIVLSSKGSSTGVAAITSLPFTNNANHRAQHYVSYYGNMSSMTNVIGRVDQSAVIAYVGNGSATGVADSSNTNWANNTEITGTIIITV